MRVEVRRVSWNEQMIYIHHKVKDRGGTHRERKSRVQTRDNQQL